MISKEENQVDSQIDADIVKKDEIENTVDGKDLLISQEGEDKDMKMTIEGNKVTSDTIGKNENLPTTLVNTTPDTTTPEKKKKTFLINVVNYDDGKQIIDAIFIKPDLKCEVQFQPDQPEYRQQEISKMVKNDLQIFLKGKIKVTAQK